MSNVNDFVLVDKVNGSGEIVRFKSVTTTPVTAVNVSAPITSTGGTTPTIGHANSGVAAGSYTNVNLTVDARGHITFVSNGSASVNWGSIGGTLSSQTDLQSALNARGVLTAAQTWTAVQTYGSTSTYRYVQHTTYNISATPASTTTWYRIATLAHVDYGQEATIYARFHRAGGNGEAFYKFVIGKATFDGVVGTTFRYEMLGRYNAAYGISAARIVEAAAPNSPSYLDVQMMTTDAFTMNVLANTVCAGVAAETALGWVSQGTGAAGTSFSCSDNYSAIGSTVTGVYESMSTAGVKRYAGQVDCFNQFYSKGAAAGFAMEDRSNGHVWAMYATSGTFNFWNSISGNAFTVTEAGALTVNTANLTTLNLPGTTAQYVRGDGSRATLPASGSGTVTSVAKGNGMDFVGFSTSGTITLGTPGTCNASSTNNVATNSHTHAIAGFMPTTGGTFTGAITAPGVTDSSDAKFKEDIRPLEDGLHTILRLRPSYFTNLLTNRREIGLIAQQVREVLPQVVVEDENGDLAVAYQRVVAPLIAAVQTLDRQLRITQFVVAALAVAVIVAAVAL